jgi:hypothetical protein
MFAGALDAVIACKIDDVNPHVESICSCYFSHPGAQAPLDIEFHACGYSPGFSKSRGQTDENMAKYQGSIDVHTSGMTRRTFLLIMFILKEGTFVRHSCTHARALGVAFSSMLRVMSFARFVMLVPHVCFQVTAFLVLAFLSFPLGFLGLVVAPIVYFLDARERKSATKHARFIQMLVVIFGLVYQQLKIVAVMCVNFSTLYRMYMILRSAYNLQVNASIKDMDRKITSLANTVYSLLLLVVTGTEPDVALVTSLCLTLVQLLRQMNEEKLKLQQIANPLKDLNENRLSTFEVALVWVKVMEVFILAPIADNEKSEEDKYPYSMNN